MPTNDSDVDDTGTLMTGFVERVGGSTSLKSADGSVHDPSLLLVEALDALITEAGAQAATSNITMAVPAHWGSDALRGMQAALNTHADFVHGDVAPRLVPDSVAALTALNSDSRLPDKGVVALLDCGGSGTSITLADAASEFTPIADSLRYEGFSGNLIDDALMMHALNAAGYSNGIDPAGLRDACQSAKERLSTETTTELALPGQRARVAISRAELDGLITAQLDGLFAAFDDLLRRNRIRSKDLAAVAMAGGTAKIPVVVQRLWAHNKTAVITAVQPGLATAVGAVKLSTRRPVVRRDGEREETTAAALVGASTGGFATSTSGLATTGRFIAPTDALGTPTGAFTASTGTFDIPTAGALFDDPSERLTELAWSQADDSDDEPVVYTGDPYDSDVNRATPSQLMQLPRVEPIEPVRTRGTRLPQLFLGLAALVSMVAIGGVAFSLTSSDRAPTLPSSSTPAPPPPVSSMIPSPSLAPPPPPTSVQPPPPPPPTTEAPPPPPPVTATVTETYVPPPPPPPKTTAQATTTTAPPQPTTTTPQATSSAPSTTPSTTPPPPPPPPSNTSTAPAMTTTYLNLPFVPVPIPVQVPEGQGGANQQQPQNPYQQNPYQQNPYQQNPYQQNPYAGPGYGY